MPSVSQYEMIPEVSVVMRKKAVLIAGAIAVTLLLGACRTAPIYNVEAQPIAVSSPGYGVEDVRKAIIRAGSRRGWIFKDEGEGKMIGTLALRKHRVTIDVSYSRDTYDVTYRDSQNMSYDGTKEVIHTNYNGWIQNLVNDISIELSLI